MNNELQLHQDRAKALQGAIDLLERLGSNNETLMAVLNNGGTREDYETKAFNVEAAEVLAAIRDMKMILSDEEGEVEAILYQEGKTGED